MSTASLPRVAVVILNWRRPADTIACLQSVVALDYDDFDVIVCDNNSGDGSIEAINAAVDRELDGWNITRTAAGRRNFCIERSVGESSSTREIDEATQRLCIIQTGRNGGYAFGNNIGMRVGFQVADVRYAWVLNNDTVVAPDALRTLVETMAADDCIGLCGSLVLYLEQPGRVQTLGGGRFLPFRARCEQLGTGLNRNEAPAAPAVRAMLSYVNGAATLVNRRLLETVGPMDEGYFLYFEEIDWAVRARAAGFDLGYCPESIVYHRVGAATGSVDDGLPSPMSTFYMERSRFRFLRKHRPWVLPLAVPLLVKGAVTRVLQGHRTTARAMLAGAVGIQFTG